MRIFPDINVGWGKKIGPYINLDCNGKTYGLCICHRREDRSFNISGHTFPVCARCTGILAGFMSGILLMEMGYSISLFYSVIFTIPLFIDGFSQAFGNRESTNVLRLVTGIMFGIGLIYVGEVLL